MSCNVCYQNFRLINSFLIVFLCILSIGDCEKDCGSVTLTYFQSKHGIGAKLSFSPVKPISNFKWVHSSSPSEPDKFGDSQYEICFDVIQERNEGDYYIECKTIDYNLDFTEYVTIQKPYAPVETLPSRTDFYDENIDIDNETEAGSSENDATEEGSTTVTYEIEEGSTAVTYEIEEGSTAVTYEIEEGSTSENDVTEGGSTAVTYETEGGSTDVTYETEGGSTTVTYETEGGSTDVTYETEGGSTDVTYETEGGSTTVTYETEEGSTSVSQVTDLDFEFSDRELSSETSTVTNNAISSETDDDDVDDDRIDTKVAYTEDLGRKENDNNRFTMVVSIVLIAGGITGVVCAIIVTRKVVLSRRRPSKDEPAMNSMGSGHDSVENRLNMNAVEGNTYECVELNGETSQEKEPKMRRSYSENVEENGLDAESREYFVLEKMTENQYTAIRESTFKPNLAPEIAIVGDMYETLQTSKEAEHVYETTNRFEQTGRGFAFDESSEGPYYECVPAEQTLNRKAKKKPSNYINISPVCLQEHEEQQKVL